MPTKSADLKKKNYFIVTVQLYAFNSKRYTYAGY